jgi:hypothetical protein
MAAPTQVRVLTLRWKRRKRLAMPIAIRNSDVSGQFTVNLGRLVSNLQSLEFVLRAFLQEGHPMGVPEGTDIYSYPVGTDLPENEFTGYDTLGRLIDKYNDQAARQGLRPIDKTLVDIRDALAHGRVSAAEQNDNLRLLKFSKPVNGRVKVVFNETLTSAWFIVQTKRVSDAIVSVHERLPR